MISPHLQELPATGSREEIEREINAYCGGW
jgi:hypothetical protein